MTVSITVKLEPMHAIGCATLIKLGKWPPVRGASPKRLWMNGYLRNLMRNGDLVDTPLVYLLVYMSKVIFQALCSIVLANVSCTDWIVDK